MDQVKTHFKGCCSIECVKSKFPILKWLPNYRLQYLSADIIAGLTVALMLLPQALAYAHVAFLPPQYGLYSSFMGCFVYVFFGTSKDITLGPTALMSLLTAEFCHIAGDYSDVYATVLCLMTGIVQLSMGILHLGIIVDFISHPVISGFTTSAAIIIAWGQVKYVLGLKNIPRDFITSIIKTFEHIQETNFADLGMGIGTIILLILLRFIRIKEEAGEETPLLQKICRKFLFFVSIGKNAVVVIVASLIAYSLATVQNYDLTLTLYVEPGLPPFEPPVFNIYNGTTPIVYASQMFSDIGIGFIIVPLLGLVEAIAIGQAFARENSYRIDPNQELMAIGAGNILGSFVSGYPVTGSFSRTAVNSQSGVKTPLGGVVTGLVVLLATAVLTSAFEFIPQAALSSVIIMAVLQMTDFRLLLTMWKINKLDILPWIATFLGSLALGVQYGIIIGVGVSFLFLLYSFARINLEYSSNVGAQVPGRDILFPACEFLEGRLHDRLLELNGKCFMLDLSSARSIDYSISHSLAVISKDYERHDKKLIIVTQNEEVRALLRRTDDNLLVFANAEDVLVGVPDAGQCLDEQSWLLRAESRQLYSGNRSEDGVENNGANSRTVSVSINNPRDC